MFVAGGGNASDGCECRGGGVKCRGGGVTGSPFGDEGAEGEIAAAGEIATSAAGDCVRTTPKRCEPDACHQSGSGCSSATIRACPTSLTSQVDPPRLVALTILVSLAERMLRSRFKLAAWEGVSLALESSVGRGGVCNGRTSSACGEVALW